MLIDEWKKRRDEVNAWNKKLIARLSKINDKKLNKLTFGLHDMVFEKVDCLDCANCCKSIPPIINDTDARRLAKSLGMKVTDFLNKYVTIDEDMDMVMNQSSCPFLSGDNNCQVYESRPKACREYPHTEDYDFVKNLKLHATNASYCPAVFQILEELKKSV